MAFMPWVRSFAGLVVLALFSVVPALAVVGPCTVTSNLDDGGSGTLRTLIADPNCDPIDFQAGLASPILLTSGELWINKNLTITGPGAASLAISGNNSSRVFEIGYLTTVAISGLTIQHGEAAEDFGGGIFNLGTLTLTNSTVSNNSARNGGGIFNNGLMTLTNSTVSGNSAPFSTGGGAGISNFVTLELINSTVSGNTSYNSGGGIFNSDGGTVTLINSTVSDNLAAHNSGGGIINYGTLELINSTVSDNRATRNSGGGIVSEGGTLTLTNSTVSGNTANFLAGGIFNVSDTVSGTVTLTNSTVSGNTSYLGGGIYNVSGTVSGTVTLTNSTVSGNSAGTEFAPGYGGGIFNAGFGTIAGFMTLNNSTVSDNRATHASGGGGIYNSNSTLTVKNTIVAHSSSGGNCTLAGGGTATSYGHNLSDDATCTFFSAAEGDLIVPAGGAGLEVNTDTPPKPILKDNGGPTQTIALLPTSPAVNAIPVSPINYCTAVNGTTPIATDQRGFLRPAGLACDIGAFELGATPPSTDTIGPLVSGVTASPSPVAINIATTLTANVDDTTTGGSNIASAAYTITGGASNVTMNPADGSFDAAVENVTASITFTLTGMYELCVRGTDVPGNVGAPACTYVPVYDPTAGFVTGGGIVNSPALADLANPSATGPATFGFVSKYLPGRSTPDGNLEFQFKAGSLNFKSTNMDWLVVTGEPRGRFQGTGTINGATVCKFAVDAWDASFSTGTLKVDAFGLKIFSCAGGGDRYSLPATPLTKGSIIIHSK